MKNISAILKSTKANDCKYCAIDQELNSEFCDKYCPGNNKVLTVVQITEKLKVKICCLGCDHKCILNVNDGYCAATKCQYQVQE